MQSPREIHLTTKTSQDRLDKYLVLKCPELSRSYIQELVRNGCATVNGIVAKAHTKLRVGDMIVFNVSPPPVPDLTPEDMPITVVYEDDSLLVIDKPPGLAVHPAPGHPDHTLVNAILSRCPEIAALDDSLRPGIIHRLDKDTSGLIMVAKTASAQVDLAGQIRNHMVTKRYLVLVRGCPSPQQGSIEAPIGRSPHDRKKMAIIANGRPSCTHYQVISRLGNYTLVEASLKTGRTHQIRVHFSHIGHPVVGDATYGSKVSFLSRQFLHAYYLGFRLPGSGDYVEFRSKLPPDLQQALDHTRSVFPE